MTFTDEDTKSIILEGLHNGANGMLVVFTKADGTERTMRATLNSALIPADENSEAEKLETTVPTPVYHQRVFDLDINQWRSFRWDRLTKTTRL